jgi:PKD domain
MVTVTDEPPVAAFTIANPTPEAGQSAAFDGTSSSDSDGSITAYAWNFGDGDPATGPTPGHSFADPGTCHGSHRAADHFTKSRRSGCERGCRVIADRRHGDVGAWATSCSGSSLTT